MHLGRLFASMGMLYAWATKEYLLWEMTIGQIIMYHNKAFEIKNGVANDDSEVGLIGKSADEVRSFRDSMREQTKLIEEQQKAALETKYGEIN